MNEIMSKNIKFLIYRLTIYHPQLNISLKKNYKRQVIQNIVEYDSKWDRLYIVKTLIYLNNV